MTTDLLAAWHSLVGPQPEYVPTDDGGFIGPDVDLFVSESDAAHRQRQVDARLGEMWGAA